MMFLLYSALARVQPEHFVKAGSLGFSLKGNQTGSPEEISKYQKCV